MRRYEVVQCLFRYGNGKVLHRRTYGIYFTKYSQNIRCDLKHVKRQL